MSAPDLPSAKGSIVLPFLVYSVLLFLLLMPVVIWRKPIVTDEQRKGWVGHHQEASNAILARRIIRERLAAQPTRWSVDTLSYEVGHGVWYSRGAVGVASPDGKEIATPYEILFVPGEPQALYDKIGSRTEGDHTAALHRTGTQAAAP